MVVCCVFCRCLESGLPHEIDWALDALLSVSNAPGDDKVRVTTEILDAPTFYYAEPYHQQYLGKNPGGYCGLGGTGVSCPIGVVRA